MMGHTPGPWKFAQYTSSDIFDADELARLVAQHPNYFEIASSFDANYNRMSISGHIGEANARLIAAAPELLEALQAILPFIPITSAMEGGASAYSENVRAADKVRTAIAKATEATP